MTQIRIFIAYMLLFAIGCTSAENSFFDDETLEKIKANTFTIVPINVYALSMDEEQVRDYYSHNCVGEMNSPRLQLNCAHLESCVGEECSILFKTHGTAFLLENGKQLITAWHVAFESHAVGLLFIQNHLASKTLEERLDLVLGSIKPQFVLLNHKREVVYDTRKDSADFKMIGDPLTPISHRNGIKNNHFYGYHENIPTDWVIFNLSDSIGEGLDLARSYEPNNEKYYNAGFGFDRFEMNFSIDQGEQESIYSLNTKLKFNDFIISKEEKSHEELAEMEIPELLSYMGYSDESVEEQMSEYSHEVLQSSVNTVLRLQQRHQRDFLIEKRPDVIFLNAKSLPGHSGCPLLNNKGEVVGLVSTGFSKSEFENGPIVSHGTGAMVFINSTILSYLD